MNIFSKINRFLFPYSTEYEKLGTKRALALGFQHAFAMSCATILVPLLTGLDVGVALFCAGCGTLIFHLCTGGRMPTFLGQLLCLYLCFSRSYRQQRVWRHQRRADFGGNGRNHRGRRVYLLLALIIKVFGKGLIDMLFPPVVRGVGITLIGLESFHQRYQ